MRSISCLSALATTLPLLMLLAACDKSGNGATAAPDRTIAAETNALDAALGDQILVDPAVAESPGTPRTPAANGAITPGALLRTPPPTPAAQANPTLGDLARAQHQRSATPSSAGCDRNFRSDVRWAERLPTGIALYPDARVSEAAGNDDPRCRMRFVTFITRAALNNVMDWYYTQTTRHGFSAEHQIIDGEHVLGGTKGDGAYLITFKPVTGGGTTVDLVANHGR